jgi:RNA polymerase sigma-70 factor, ECF subfamily
MTAMHRYYSVSQRPTRPPGDFFATMCKKPAPSEDYPDVTRQNSVNRDQQDAMYAEARSAHGAALRRLARAYEVDPDKQRDLLQEMHLQLWLSFRSFDGRCSLRTWVYRIAHNAGASHVMRSRRSAAPLVELETLETGIPVIDGPAEINRSCSASTLLRLIHQLKPLDRQVILLHLEGERADSIAEVTGLSAVNVATKIHRIKKLLKHMYAEGVAYV